MEQKTAERREHQRKSSIQNWEASEEHIRRDRLHNSCISEGAANNKREYSHEIMFESYFRLLQVKNGKHVGITAGKIYQKQCDLDAEKGGCRTRRGRRMGWEASLVGNPCAFGIAFGVPLVCLWCALDLQALCWFAYTDWLD